MEENTKTGMEAAGEETKNSTQSEKLFTQEEVNSFIQTRLSQMKKQAVKESTAEYESKLKALEERELKLTVKEELSKRGMPAELADIITGVNAEEIGQKLDKLNEIYGKEYQTEKKEKHSGFFCIGASQAGRKEQPDAIRAAMGLVR
ncbi:MAG: DUF4355 domain-containing protein [Lachnospiraceae bacterium]